MDIITCIFKSLCLLLVADGFTVRGPSAPLSAPLGSSVVLPCYVDEALPMEDLEVEWRKADSETLVDSLSLDTDESEVQQQEYQERAHFFTEEIQHGNFSLRLYNLRAEDEGEYRCTVHSQRGSGEIVVQIKVVESWFVSESNRPVSAYIGDDVTLNCSVDSHINPEHIKEVLWIKTDEDDKILVLPYQNNKIFSDSSHEQFRGRVEFFTAEMPKGNFSLRLKSVRFEDKGVYKCYVFTGDLTFVAIEKLERLGFFSLHIAVLFFCVSAGSGALLLLCRLIYCRLNTVSSSTIWNLQLSLVLFPNICMFFAFILWGLTEGYLHETITCSALYILRPFMLIWALPFLKYLRESLKPWISFFTATREFAIFALVVYSVFFSYRWKKRTPKSDNTHLLIYSVYTGILVVICLIFTTVDILKCCCREQQRERSQTQGHICFPFGVLDFILWLACISFSLRPPAKCHCKAWIAVLGIMTILILDIILLMYVHLALLEGDKAKELLEKQRQTSEQESVCLCNEVMYMFGAVGIVLLSSVSLAAELILKALNGERAIGDLRVIVFPFESAFVLYWLLLQMHAYWRILTSGSTDSRSDSSQRPQHENCEMETIHT
ncbi:uncharacterized protein isoform X2 [Danio rerio]|uniref:Uncharacterized protein isoform X2 n=1 Tax=Danio rerio TaxID=7955 RepID=A0AC58J193_DANRE